MIDPFKITNYQRTTEELEEFWLFCLAVAGKRATMIAAKIDEFLSGRINGESPFEYVDRLANSGELLGRLKEVRMGKYALLEAAFANSAEVGRLDLRGVSPQELEELPGVGPKTSRFFIMHSRENAHIAVIDTHVTKYLKERGYDVPNGVPTGKVYARLEQIMIAETKASGMSPADFDLAIWSHYASNGEKPLPTVPMTLAA
ncbi:hypothetical protein [Mesorhizobium sp. SP-1A]|uniref:hypothetical protein n=1 Tax=Mesorhizobium sp. SP-1A TaxID=3077840 RepID=UPI0028F6C3DC|nr:hypothetical protein [Mesorhizobium sp. SP-1A]